MQNCNEKNLNKQLVIKSTAHALKNKKISGLLCEIIKEHTLGLNEQW